jgi:hypothetical protein
MKKVFRNADEVIHAFAQQPYNKEAEGRSGNIYFDGFSLYSYGRHYELARYLDIETVLINDTGYSVTTAKHISKARHALSQYRRFYVTLCNPEAVSAQLRALRAKLSKARKPSKYINEAFGIVEAYRSYMHYAEAHPNRDEMPYLKSAYRLQIGELANFFESFTNSEEMQAIFKAEREAEKKRQELNAQKFREAFYAFEPFEALRNAARLPYSLIRVNGEFVETSQNVRIPLTVARVALKRFDDGALKNGDRIDVYSVKDITTEYIRIGCHLMKLSDIRGVLA